RRRHTRWPRDWSSDVCSSDLDRRGSSARLLRALAELQNLFLLARIGEVGDNPGNYAFVWDLLVRWLPDVPGRAAGISHRAAAAEIGRASCRERGCGWRGGGWV